MRINRDALPTEGSWARANLHQGLQEKTGSPHPSTHRACLERARLVRLLGQGEGGKGSARKGCVALGWATATARTPVMGQAPVGTRSNPTVLQREVAAAQKGKPFPCASETKANPGASGVSW